MEVGLRRFLQVASLKREASGLDPEAVHAHHDTDASRHETGVTALNRVLRSAEYGRVVMSDYVYDETVTLTLRRTGQMKDALEHGRRLRGDGYPDAIDILFSSPARFDDAVAVFEQYEDHELSFTDAMTVALVQYHDIDSVLSFDDDFDGIVDRLAPVAVANED